MKFWSTTILGLALVGALASPAFTQGEGADAQLSDFQLTDGRVLVVTPSGEVVQRQITDAAMTKMMLKDAKPLEAGTVIFMRGKTMYMTPDRKMKSGRMLSDMVIHGPK